ncbi:hypothetical protein Taro_040080 [Colocasia esculenta]|uniref:Uncharacterized protein n=1 Tax=Colocasia esculenta TaxID=4460 RepID=A0A843WHM6_COLES|nr:hypothetical protein [Colocasia esculenta]
MEGKRAFFPRSCRQERLAPLAVLLLGLLVSPASAHQPFAALPHEVADGVRGGGGPTCCNTCEREGSALFCEDYFYYPSDLIANCKILVCHPSEPFCVCRDELNACPPRCFSVGHAVDVPMTSRHAMASN